jgi:hypothetical protein
MSIVVLEGLFGYNASQPNLLRTAPWRKIALNLLSSELFPEVWQILVTFVVLQV